MGYQTFLSFGHVNYYAIFSVLLLLSKPSIGGFILQCFSVWPLCMVLSYLIRKYNSAYEGQVTDKGIESPSGGEDSRWEYWIKLEQDKNVVTKKVTEDLYIQVTHQVYVKKVPGSFNILINQKLVKIYVADVR